MTFVHVLSELLDDDLAKVSARPFRNIAYQHTFELLGGIGCSLLRLRVWLLSLYFLPSLPLLLLLDGLLLGLLALPLRRGYLPRSEGVREGLRDLDRERGDTERRGERDMERVCDLLAVGNRERDRPRDGDLEGIG